MNTIKIILLATELKNQRREIMRNIINNVIATGVVLLCVVPTISFAVCDNPLSKKIAFSVHPKQKIYNDLTSCKKIPNNPELTIFTSILEKEIIPGAEERRSIRVGRFECNYC
jgi:hypothetical protein